MLFFIRSLYQVNGDCFVLLPETLFYLFEHGCVSREKEERLENWDVPAFKQSSVAARYSVQM
jgi:hypothetical protein